MDKNTKILIAFLTGALAGTMMGMLYAPDKGRNLRDKWSYRLDKYRKTLRDMLDKMTESKAALNGSNTAKEEGQKVVEDAREKAEKLLNDVEQLIDQIRSKQ